MKQCIRTSLLMTAVTTIVLGLVYPLTITGAAQLLFPRQANGDLIERNGRIVGSKHLGQAFSEHANLYSLAQLLTEILAEAIPLTLV